MNWMAQSSTWRLRAGAHVFQEAEDRWILCTPEEEFVRISLPPEVSPSFKAVLQGVRAPVSDFVREGELGEVLDAFYAEGLLQEQTPDGPTEAPAPPRILVIGENPLARSIANLFLSSGAMVESISTTTLNLSSLAQVDCAVAASGWLPDALWTELDEQYEAAGTPWHRVYLEGPRLFIGPLTIPRVSASYRDLRMRRIAASPWPEELQAHWRALDDNSGIGTVDWPAYPALVAAASALACDVLTYLAGGHAPGAIGQVEFDATTWFWHTHPVLPIPRGIMTVAP